ncbi:protein N-terminal asparagine amidohydrolase-like [Lytechinus pictus]|uniref:protein N-terminal asparagine amidohydrolase-like n=1 Tax=Lytechinus pictus TaxID=7653 RepID=UPI0030BA2734
MPLMIDGQLYHPKENVMQLVEDYPKFKDEAAAFCTKPVHHCEAIDLLYVNQREYAVTIPSDNIVKILGSDDATTCHIIVLRHSGSGATALAHLDGHGIEGGIANMLASILTLSTGCSEGRLELHIFGGFCDSRGESVEISANVFSIFHKCVHDIHLVTACMSELNDTVKDGIHWPILYGVAVNVNSGEIFPASFADKGPDKPLRSVYTLFGNHHMRNVYDHSSGLHMISPFTYRAMPYISNWLLQPDSFIREHLSTSPEVEPPYFEEGIRDAIRWVMNHPHPTLTVFPGNKPRVYTKNQHGLWVDYSQASDDRSSSMSTSSSMSSS